MFLDYLLGTYRCGIIQQMRIGSTIYTLERLRRKEETYQTSDDKNT
jgi:hypothetical protein